MTQPILYLTDREADRFIAAGILREQDIIRYGGKSATQAVAPKLALRLQLGPASRAKETAR